MCIICDGNYNVNIYIINAGLTYLDCHKCQYITTIPYLPLLTELICYECPLLTNIPDLPSLTYLHCGGCPLLSHIPKCSLITNLWCYDCPLITHIPYLPLLIILECSLCPFLYLSYKMRSKFGKPLKKLLNKTRFLQIKTKRNLKNKVSSIIFNNTIFYPVLIDIITDY